MMTDFEAFQSKGLILFKELFHDEKLFLKIVFEKHQGFDISVS